MFFFVLLILRNKGNLRKHEDDNFINLRKSKQLTHQINQNSQAKYQSRIKENVLSLSLFFLPILLSIRKHLYFKCIITHLISVNNATSYIKGNSRADRRPMVTDKIFILKLNSPKKKCAKGTPSFLDEWAHTHKINQIATRTNNKQKLPKKKKKIR